MQHYLYLLRCRSNHVQPSHLSVPTVTLALADCYAIRHKAEPRWQKNRTEASCEKPGSKRKVTIIMRFFETSSRSLLLYEAAAGAGNASIFASSLRISPFERRKNQR